MAGVQKIINELIEEHQDWILRQKTKQQKINSALSDWHDPDTLYFRGKKVEWRYSDVPVTAFMANQILVPCHLSKVEFLKSMATAYLPERCLDIAEMMGLKAEKVKIRQMRSCWGTCNVNGTILLNQALIQAPDWVSDYVMIHECAHLVHFNHSKAFWAWLVVLLIVQNKQSNG